MRGLLFLATRHLLHNRLRSVVLIAVLTIVISLPVLASLVVSRAEQALASRGASTPLVYGAHGSDIDLVLGTAYFVGAVPEPIAMADYRALIDLRSHHLAPVRLAGTARGFPLVGVDVEYFRLRGLALEAGNLPLRAGEVVLGSAVAAALSARPGDVIRTDTTAAFDLAAAYPVGLTVTGVLTASGTPDDRAVFGDLRTAWIAEGFGHGHQDLDPQRDRKLLLGDGEEGLVANASLQTYTVITADNRDAFHYHGDEGTLPLSGIVVFPRSPKAAALLKGRVADAASTRQLVDVGGVVDRLLSRVFQVRAILNGAIGVMGLAVLLAMGLVIVLSVRMRRREFEVASQIGAPRSYAVSVVVAELFVLLAVAVAITAILAGAAYLLDDGALLSWFGEQGA